jgi:hypothetical protein
MILDTVRVPVETTIRSQLSATVIEQVGSSDHPGQGERRTIAATPVAP